MQNFGSAELTVVSLSDRVPDPPERRSEQRHLSVLRVGKIMMHTHEELCLIRNISGGGLMAHVYSIFTPGDSITLEIKNGHVLEGQVAWFQDEMVGIRFTQRINVLDFLANDHDDPTAGIFVRPPRLTIRTAALIRRGADYLHADLYDISQGGAKIGPGDAFDVDDEVVLMIPGFAPMNASVRWRKDGRAGVGFHQMIGFETLAIWAAERAGRRG